MTELFVDYRVGRSEWKLCSLADIEKHRVDADFHVTWQRYRNDHIGHLGEIYGNFVADFDYETDIGIAQRDCIKVYDFLVNGGVNPKNIRLFFSGRKGFHLEINYRSYMERPVFDLHLIYRELYKHLERKIKPEKRDSTMDKSMYYARKTLRYPNTRHPVSGLYCVPLTREELSLPPERIFDLAGSPRPFDESYVDDPKMRKYFIDCQTAYWKSVEDFEKRTTLVKTCSGGYPPCIKKIMDEGLPPGTRNDTIYLLARFLKGIKSEQEVYQVLEDLAGKSYANFDGIKEARSTIKSALRREGSFLSCSKLSYWCDKEQCSKDTKKESMGHTARVEKVFNVCSYKDAAISVKAAIKRGEYNRALLTGIPKLDDKTKILRDSLITIGALSDVGKTSLAITLAKNNQDKRILYLAIEEGQDRTALRLIRSRIPEDDKITVITGRMGSITPDDVYSLAYKYSSRFDFMIIDQLVNLTSAAKEERLKYKFMMEKFREIAREFKKPIFVLHQLNRSAKFNQDKEPSKEQLAEGADIERLSYDVWLLYRRKVGDKTYNLLKIDKNKNYRSPVIVPLEYDDHTNTFTDYPSMEINWEDLKEIGIDKQEYLYGRINEDIRVM